MELLDKIQVIATIATPFITIAGFAVIKFNDFRHLEKDVIEIKDHMKDQTKKVEKINTKVAVLEAKTHNLEKEIY